MQRTLPQNSGALHHRPGSAEGALDGRVQAHQLCEPRTEAALRCPALRQRHEASQLHSAVWETHFCHHLKKNHLEMNRRLIEKKRPFVGSSDCLEEFKFR